MPDKRSNPTTRTMLIGASMAGVCLLFLPLPLITGAKIGRFIVAFAFIGLLMGASILLNGAIDYWRRQ